jgi:uncharacterized protein YjbJ (UPF0337 family)
MSGLLDRITGRFKKTAGEVTADSSLRREGSREEAKGETRDQLSDAQAEVERKAQQVADLERET